MKFSVVVATYKRAQKLDNCLRSLVVQTWPKNDYELIIVEDGSAVAEEICKKYSARYVWQENKGPASARNLGIKKAQGEIISFTDDDCVVPTDWLQNLAEGYKRHPEVVGVGGYLAAPEASLRSNFYAQYERYVSQGQYRTGSQEEVSGFENPAGGTNNISYKKKVIEEVGYFDESLNPAGEDGDLKKRITDKNYQILYLPLKVEHHRDYNLVSFLRQSFNRGWGSYLVQKKRGHAPSQSEIYVQLLLSLPKFLLALFFKPERKFAWLNFIFKIQEYRGMLHAIK